MAVAAKGVSRVPVRVADCFLLALDSFMRRTGQGAHVSQSVLELDRAPDLEKLRAASRRLVEKHPIFAARLRRDWRTWLPFWEVPEPPASGLPLRIWEAAECEDFAAVLQSIFAEPLVRDGVNFNARLDLLQRPDGRAALTFSWSHLLIDGKGAELLLAELARLCDGLDEPCEAKEIPRPALTFKERIQKTKGAVILFDELVKIGAPSLSGPRPRRGRGFYQVITLSPADTAIVAARIARTTGELFPMTFLLACTARAHDRVFAHRGRQPRGYVANVPVQMRKRGARGPLFHNQVSVFFFSAVRANLGSIESTAAAMKQQFTEMSRARLDESFSMVLEMMMRLPSWVFMRVVRWQFKGEIASFFHSHTGPFAPELTEFAGAKITNAYHLPCLGAPPGTGIFFGDRDGRLNITFSWREGCLTDDERRLMVGQTLEDLLGEKRPDLTDAGR